MRLKNTTYSSHPTRASKAAHKAAKKNFPTYDTSLIQPKKDHKKPIFFAVLIAVILAIVIGAVVLFTTGCVQTLAAGKTAQVYIEEGSSTSEIADKMANAGVVSSAAAFKSTASEMGASSSLKPGTYIFEGGKTVEEYIEQLVAGPDANAQKVIVAEGMTIKSIGKAIEEATNGRLKSSDFVSAASDASKYASKYDFLSEVGTNSLEGFLFPKTYIIKNDATVKDLIYDMLDQFKTETKDLDWGIPQARGLSKYDVVKLASIVEKESTPSVRARVASVFYNRIKEGMYLNSDATTAYVVGHDPTPEEVHSDSPYSTYTNMGLPPTPICNPGLECLKAVCDPENTNYLYFYFANDKDGNVVYRFSETYEQHQNAISELG